VKILMGFGFIESYCFDDTNQILMPILLGFGYVKSWRVQFYRDLLF